MVQKGLSWKTKGDIKFPLKKLAVVACVLLVIGSIGVLYTREQERSRQMNIMRDQAKILIWAVEGGAKAMPMHETDVSPVPQAFVEAIGRQPTVAYVAILDKYGKALANSDPNKIGLVPDGLAPDELSALVALSKGVLMHSDGHIIYGGAKLLDIPRHGGMRNRKSLAERYYIVVGLDAEVFLSEIDKNVLQFTLIMFLVLLTSMSGVILVFYMQSLTLSTRILKDTQLLASQVFEHLPIGVLATTSSGGVILYNESAVALLGLQNTDDLSSQLYGHPWFDWAELVQRVRPDAPFLEHELDFTDVHGRTVAVSISAYLITLADGPIYLFIMRDVFEVKKLQKRLRLNERLTALGDLAAGVAHELRNPLSAVKGYATFFALKLKDNPEMLDNAKNLQIEVDRLSRVVSDLLGMAKPGEIRLRQGALVPLVARSVHLAEYEAAAKNVQLTLQPVAPSDEHKLIAKVDADRFVQMLLNFIINGIQASDPGGHVNVSLKFVPGSQTGQSGKAVLSVSDTGVGIAKEALANIFTPYFTTKPSGTGLGLPIAHRIIEEHGAEVTVSSKPGKGSVFNVLLPTVIVEE